MYRWLDNGRSERVSKGITKRVQVSWNVYSFLHCAALPLWDSPAGRGRTTSLWRQRSRKTGSGPAAFIIFPYRYPRHIPSNGLIHKLQPEFQAWIPMEKSFQGLLGGFFNPFVYFKWPRERWDDGGSIGLLSKRRECLLSRAWK